MHRWVVLFLFFSAGLWSQNQLKVAQSFMLNGDHYNAKIILQEVVAEDASFENLEALGDAHCHLMEWDEAIPLYKELSSRFPKNAEYHFKYGGALARKAEKASKFEALMLVGKIKTSFLKVAELDKNHIEVRWGLIDYYATVPKILGGSMSKAYQFAHEIKRISPVEGYFAMAYVHNLDGKPKEAREQWKLTVAHLEQLKDPERNQLNFLAGKVCAELGVKLDLGIDRMKTFIKNHSVRDGVPIAQAYYSLAKLYRLKNDKEQANFWIKKTLTKASDFKPALEEEKRIALL